MCPRSLFAEKKSGKEFGRTGVYVLDRAVRGITQDYAFNSPSTAAGVMTGRSANWQA